MSAWDLLSWVISIVLSAVLVAFGIIIASAAASTIKRKWGK